MSRSPQIKRARWPKTDLVSRENVLESYNLANDAAWWRACSVGTVCGCVCPPRLRYDSLTGQGASEYAGTMQDE